MSQRTDQPTVQERKGASPDEPKPAPPRRRHDRYDLQNEIARGGMGRVLEADDRVLGRVVAVKEALVTDDDGLRRFARETRITALLEHPAIVPVYDAGVTADDTPYYVMRKVSGKPLHDLIAGAADFDLRLGLVPHVLAAAQGVAHAHSRGVIHRDLKPQNILVGGLGETVVIDWGLAKVLGEADDLAPATERLDAGSSLRTVRGAVMGTPGFMPPEQAESADVGKPADVYALGATLYYLLARRPPLPDRAPISGAPRELVAIVDRALAHDPSDRYPDASAFADDLAKFLTGRVVAAHHYTRREHVLRFVRRHRLPLAIAGAAVAALAIGTWFAVSRVGAARIETDEEHRIAELERERIRERDIDLQLERTRVLIDRDPGRAVAQLLPFSDSDRWREARDLAANARARGIAQILPTTAVPMATAVSPDGISAAVVGHDGVVHLYDLKRRRYRDLTVSHQTASAHLAFQDATHLVVRLNDALSIIDLSTDRTTRIEPPSPVGRIAVAPGQLAWIDRTGRVFRLDGGTPVEVAVSDRADAIAFTDDGARLAIGGSRGVHVVEGGAVATVLAEPTMLVQWSPDGTHLGAQTSHQLVDLDVRTKDAAVIPMISTQSIAYVGTTMVALGFDGMRSSSPAYEVPVPPEALPINVLVARGDLVCAGGTSGDIIVADGQRRVTLPVDRELKALDGDPRSPYLLAVIHSDAVVWNLEDVMGRELPLADTSFSSSLPIAPHHVALARYGKPLEIIDAVTGKSTYGPTVNDAPTLLASRTGRAVAAIGHDHALRLLVPRDELIAQDVRAVAFVDDDNLAVARPGKRLDMYRIGARTLQPIREDTEVEALRSDGVALYATEPGNVVTRIDLGTGKAWTSRARYAPAMWATGSKGVAWASSLRTVVRWSSSGSVLHANTPADVIAVVGEVGGKLAIDTSEGGLLVDIEHDEMYENTLSFGSSERVPGDMIVNAELLPDAGLVSIPARDGTTTMFDVTSGEAWTMARSARLFDGVRLAPDGSVLFEVGERLHVWDAALPPTREATAAWFRALTEPFVHSF